MSKNALTVKGRREATRLRRSAERLNSPRQVLMLVSLFPPGPQAILRALKFVKYLPEFGWHPLVITSRQRVSDTDLNVEHVPEGAFVCRTHRVATPSMILRSLRSRIVKAAVPTFGGGQTHSNSSQGWRGLVRTALSWGDIPDEFVGWLPFALLRGIRLVRKRPIQAIYADGPPFTGFLAGALLSRATRVPLVLDFRDAWMLDPSDPFGTRGGLYRSRASERRLKLLERLEAWSLSGCVKVLFTSRTTKELYERRYPALASKSRLIVNGVDPDDFASPVVPFERLTLSHVGTLHDYQAEQTMLLLDAWGALIRSNEFPGSRLALIGPIIPELRLRIETAVASLGLSRVVELPGPVPHGEAVAWLRRSTALVLLAGQNQFIRLSKISEYAAAGRPLLALAAQESETARNAVQHGAVLPSGEGAAPIAEAIRRVLKDGIMRPPGTEPFPFVHPHPLNRRTEAAELAAVLDAVGGDPSEVPREVFRGLPKNLR